MFFHQALQQSRAKERNWKAEEGRKVEREKKYKRVQHRKEGKEADVVEN